MKNASNPGNRIKIIITSFIFIVFLITLASVNEIRFENVSNFGKCAISSPSSNISSLKITSAEDEIRILLGIPTMADNYQRRHFLRLIYGTQPVVGAKIDLKFVFCNLTKEDQRILIALEIMQYNDIIILNCQENMDKGKTYTYFSSLPDMMKDEFDSVNPPYHYVIKGDDDTYFRLPKLVETLRPLPREDLYFGYLVPCPNKDRCVHYMSGMGYLVSWDIVEWIKDSDIPKEHFVGPEDKIFGEWLRDGRRAKNRYDAKGYMYDYPDPPTRSTHELWPETVAVHRLKTQEKWIRTLEYFNVTRDLKPSKLYHIP
ncbi:beta-1,3-galactosyltransferase pvg3-like [Rutidosis leptorrhynchoides]|uniref:beta-1,3-galactosyltransferase pvg3-like n=1 Tax=Rutidosis leptorrhynchoides TaxID=125765 RepID=UPI003A9A49B0